MKELLIKIDDEDIMELMKVCNAGDGNEIARMAINETIKKQVYSHILTLKGELDMILVDSTVWIDFFSGHKDKEDCYAV